MNVLLRKSFSIVASLALPILSVGSASGQASKVEGSDLSFDDLPSPEFSGGKQKSFKPKDWLEIETKLKISLRPEPKSKTCDRFTIKWYVAVKNPDKPGTMLLLSKDVEHVNAPLDEDIYCSVYLSPASITRLTGSAKNGKNAVEYVGYEVLIDGRQVAVESNKTVKGKKEWWNLTSDSLSRSDAVPLLDKMHTPFSNMWWDRYAEIAEERR